MPSAPSPAAADGRPFILVHSDDAGALGQRGALNRVSPDMLPHPRYSCCFSAGMTLVATAPPSSPSGPRAPGGNTRWKGSRSQTLGASMALSLQICRDGSAAGNLSRGTWAFSLRCGVQGLQLQRAGSSVAACRLLAVTGGIWFFDQESDPDPLPRECRVLAAGPPCRSLSYT